MALEARSHLRNIQPCAHGSFSYRESAERGIPREEVLDFSANCNPLGPAPGVLAALRHLQLARYPDNEAVELRGALARSMGLDPGWIIAGNGSVELMWLLATAYLETGDHALVSGPTFGEYARACQVAGATVETVLASEKGRFQPDLAGLIHRIDALRPKLAFLCNPNNPTGQLLPAQAIGQLLEACEDTLLVVDEAYLPFCQSSPDLVPYLSTGKLLLLRSMTKDHALAGLRLGYAVARPDVIEWLDRVRPPWNVNAAAQAAGIAALRERRYLEESRRVVEEGRRYLTDQLSKLGLRAVPSTANFLLVRVGRGASFRAMLLERGICVRDCTSFGLPAYIRIGIRTLPDCQRLVEVVQELLQNG